MQVLPCAIAAVFNGSVSHSRLVLMLNRTVAAFSRLTTTALSARSIVSEERRAVDAKLMATLAPANVMPTEQPAVVEPPAKQRCLPPALRVKLLKANATLPTRGSCGAAGYDISSAEACTIPARGKYIVSTGLSLAIPPECYGRVAPRSGLAAKHSIDTGAGVIDSDYRGELKVILFNFSDQDFQIKEGDRIAQLVLERIMIAEVVEVESLDGTDRGAGGFGSTGGFGNENSTKA